MRNLFFAICAMGAAIWIAAGGAVWAQSSPGLYNGQTPTAGQWNSYFAAKQDYKPGFFGSSYTWTSPQTWSANATFQAHVALAGGSPAITSCGTSPTVSGSDASGEITSGTGAPTSCTLTFRTAYNAAPVCIVEDRSALANLTSYTVTTTAVVLTTSAASSQKIAYICVGA